MSQAMENGGQSDGLREEASTRVHEAASVAQEKVTDLKEKGASRLETELDNRSTHLGTQLTSMARTLRSSSTEPGGDGNPAAKLAEPAAEQLDRLGSYLQRTDGEQLMNELESFARQRPWMLAGAGLLAGVAAARFVKASSDRRAAGAVYRTPGATRTTTPAGSPAGAPGGAAGSVGTIGSERQAAPAYSVR